MTENNAPAAENKATEVEAEPVKTDVKATDVKPAEPTKPTAEELAKMFSELPEVFQDSVKKLNAEITEHNKKVESVIAAEAKNPKLIMAEIFEQNPGNNKKLAALYKEYSKLIEAAESLKDQAYKVIETDGLMPKELTTEEIEKLKAETSTGAKSLRDNVSALATMEDMMPMLKGKVVIHVEEIKTRRGVAKTGSAAGNSGTGPKRLRFKRVEINDQIEDSQGNKVYGITDGEKKFTFTFASAFLRKQHKAIKWTSNDLTEAYLAELDENNLPESHTFVMPFTYQNDNGNDVTVNYTVKAFR